MEINSKNMCAWELQKAGYLIMIAGQLGMDVSGYGECSVNPNSGNTYIWLEGYNFTLYMPISCELKKSDIWVVWTDPEDGEETEKTLDEFNNLTEIEEWCTELQEQVENE